MRTPEGNVESQDAALVRRSVLVPERGRPVCDPGAFVAADGVEDAGVRALPIHAGLWVPGHHRLAGAPGTRISRRVDGKRDRTAWQRTTSQPQLCLFARDKPTDCDADQRRSPAEHVSLIPPIDTRSQRLGGGLIGRRDWRRLRGRCRWNAEHKERRGN
jgi:hypothetical protein